MPADALKPIPEEVNREIFARACLAGAREYSANAQYLFAFADLVSQIRNLAPKASTACGPFQITDEIWNEAIAALRRVVELDPRNTNSAFMLALTYMSVRHFSDALTIADHILAVEPTN